MTLKKTDLGHFFESKTFTSAVIDTEISAINEPFLHVIR